MYSVSINLVTRIHQVCERSFDFKSGQKNVFTGHGQEDQIDGQFETESIDEQKVPATFCT